MSGFLTGIKWQGPLNVSQTLNIGQPLHTHTIKKSRAESSLSLADLFGPRPVIGGLVRASRQLFGF